MATRSIDGFIQIWIVDAADSNRWDFVTLFGGFYGTDPAIRMDEQSRLGPGDPGARFDVGSFPAVCLPEQHFLPAGRIKNPD